ncbi:MAG: hypothetical protein LQ340_001569 [Diploschistes diacapsis]|nr:MAG: hypothetical protein LQ340_001569 [Diploschistes diacapsis]
MINASKLIAATDPPELSSSGYSSPPPTTPFASGVNFGDEEQQVEPSPACSGNVETASQDGHSTSELREIHDNHEPNTVETSPLGATQLRNTSYEANVAQSFSPTVHINPTQIPPTVDDALSASSTLSDTESFDRRSSRPEQLFQQQRLNAFRYSSFSSLRVSQQYRRNFEGKNGGVSKYSLRPLVEHHPGSFEAWYDMDDSGSFDPCRPISSLLTGTRKRPKTDCDTIFDPKERSRKKRRVLNLSYGRWTDESAPVTLHLSKDTLYSLKGQSILAALSTSPENWPAHVNELIAPEENFTELSLSAIQPSKLRDRAGLAPHASSQGEVLPPEEIALGHPAARGCKACFEIRLPCNLIEDENERWPCAHCREENEECELLLEPSQKRTCERCRKRRIMCSFRTSEDHMGACEQCREKGLKCVAGPASGRTKGVSSLQ